jgi:S1-C subfamily serine protease
MPLFFRFLFAVFFLSICFNSYAETTRVKNAVVKIYTVYNQHNYHEPWQKKGQDAYHGSGCIIEGNRILTNAHVVSDQTFIQVRRAGKAKKYTALVDMVGHESDLAILKVLDPAFFSGVQPVSIGKLPEFRDTVAVYGFPEGGDKLSITEGVVSRVEHGKYAHSNAFLLTCQIDASINSGSSGGPVIKDNQIVGVAFQGMKSSAYENIGYMVPAPVIRHFLEDIQDGRHDGTPSLCISMQKMENPDMRLKYHMPPEETGVLVNTIYPDSPAKGILEPGDVIVSIDGENIESDGTIEFRAGERTFFGYIMQKKHIHDTVDMVMRRQNKRHKRTISLLKTADVERLVPYQQYDRPPTYFITGGLVFEPLTLNYLTEYGGKNWYFSAPTELVHLYINGEPTENRREVVILVKVLADEINVGYHIFSDAVVTEVNGKKISTIKGLITAFESHTGKFQTIKFKRGYQIILDREKVDENKERILKKYQIPRDRSTDLMQPPYPN